MPRRLSCFACVTLLCLPWALPARAAARAGEVAALKPAATRNAQPASLREELDWNDVLATGPSGRLRAALADGSQLSLGSSTQLTVAAHNPQSQQTELQLLYGRLRSRVVPLTQPGSKFQVKTPTAAVGVIGTDFYVAADARLTTVICYRGTVSVSGLGRDRRTVTLQAGQTVEVTLDTVGVPQAAAAALLRQTLALTSAGDLLDLPPGSPISALLEKTLDARKAKAGDAIVARVERSAKLEGQAVLPRKAKLLGRVEEARARGRGAPESRLGIVFDHVLLPGGEQVVLRATLQALAAPAPGPAVEEASFPAETQPPAAATSRSAGGGVLGRTAAVAGTQVAGATSATAALGTTLPSLDASGRLTVASQGSVNLPGIALAPQTSLAGGAVISSNTQNVRLESGTQILLRTAGPPPSSSNQ